MIFQKTYQNCQTMYLLIIVTVFVIFYILAIATVFNAVKEKCKNGELIVILTVIGIMLQTICLTGLYMNWNRRLENGSMLSGCRHSNASNDVGLDESQNELDLRKQTDREDISFYDELVAYLMQETVRSEISKTINTQFKFEEHVSEDENGNTASYGSSNTVNADFNTDGGTEIRDGKKVYRDLPMYLQRTGNTLTDCSANDSNRDLTLSQPEDVTTDDIDFGSRSDLEIGNDNRSWCFDLRIIALILTNTMFLSFLLGIPHQFPTIHQRLANWCVVVYYYIMTCVIARMYITRTNDIIQTFETQGAMILSSLSICSQEAKEQILPFVLETVCLHGFAMILLFMTLFRVTGGTFRNRYPVFEECISEDGGMCCTCGGEVFQAIVKCYAFFTLVVRPIHFTYDYVTNDNFADIFLVLSNLAAFLILIFNNFGNMISKAVRRPDGRLIIV